MSDVARLAGVHKATASRALNPSTSGRVNAATARRVRAAAEELGFTLNTAARSLRTNRSFTVGVLLPDLTNPLFPPVARGIEEVLTARGYTALLANTDNDEAKERHQFDVLLGRQVDGFIVATAQREHALLEEAHKSRVPIVLLNRCTDQPLFPLVAGDDNTGILFAVRHLLDRGHRSIAHVAGPQDVSTGITRARAFRHAMEIAGISHEQALVVPAQAYTVAAGERATEELLDHHPATTAIVAGNDLIALGALHVLRARGLRCPQDISLVGFNDMQFADEFQPPLTTVHVPHLELGAEAARLLLEQLDSSEESAGGAPVAKTVLFPLHLVVRESTADVADREGGLG
ncbi:LacI family transcriptional regulator [Streptomyces spongiae]|uniref:LacI family transcriptional regulator n=2 Tax=Streptomyces spongiae TaxID=565072 RepID=A0A5N8XAF0_9ACTN|nr:LacI family transcriptional regulator [Streptomyces spongiae]